MRRYLPLCLLVTLLPLSTGCGESPNRPTVVTETPRNPPKTNQRFIQAPWDISLFFNLPGGAVVAGAATAATPGAAAEGDNLTGTFVNSTGFAGTLTGVLTGTLENGNFNGILSTITQSGCTAERRFSGPITTAALNWSPGAQINDCGGASPLTSGIQVAAAPPTAPPPCTYEAAATGTSVPSAGGTGTVTVGAGEGCAWFATSSATFVTLNASQGTAAGSVQFTVAANTSTTERTAVLVVAGSSFTITQAAAPPCAFRLTGTEETFDAAGGRGGVDVRTAAHCAWRAESDAPWLTIRRGSAGTGDGTIGYEVDANPRLTTRVGKITAQRQVFTVTQLGVVCQYTVTPSTTEAPFNGGSGTIQVAPSAAVCPWSASVNSDAPWITLTPRSGTGQGSVAFTVAANPDPVARTGVVTVAGRQIAIAQGPAPCVFTLTPSTTAIPPTGGTATIGVATHAACTWTATVGPNASWITVASGGSGSGNGTVRLNFAANPLAQQRPGAVTIGTATVTFTQGPSTVGILTGVVINSVNKQPVAGATVLLSAVGSQTPLTTTTNAAGSYTFSSVQQGPYNVVIQRAGFDDFRTASPITINAAQTTTLDVVLVARPVNLTITWNPQSTRVDPADPDCDGNPAITGPYCWESDILFRETNGTAAIFSRLTIHFFDSNGVPTSPFAVAGTWNPLPFTVPGGGNYPGFVRITHTLPAAKRVEIEFFGTDAYGQTIPSVRTPPLILEAFPVIGLRSSDQTTDGTAVTQTGTGGGQSGGRPIRRR